MSMSRSMSMSKRLRELIVRGAVMLPVVPNAAMAARRNPNFMIIARTDSRAVEDFTSAVKRAHKYLDAGADAIFPEALQSAEEFRDFANQVKAPLLANMTEFGKSPLLSFRELA